MWDAIGTALAIFGLIAIFSGEDLLARWFRHREAMAAIKRRPRY